MAPDAMTAVRQSTKPSVRVKGPDTISGFPGGPDDIQVRCSLVRPVLPLLLPLLRCLFFSDPFTFHLQPSRLSLSCRFQPQWLFLHLLDPFIHPSRALRRRPFQRSSRFRHSGSLQRCCITGHRHLQPLRRPLHRIRRPGERVDDPADFGVTLFACRSRQPCPYRLIGGTHEGHRRIGPSPFCLPPLDHLVQIFAHEPFHVPRRHELGPRLKRLGDDQRISVRLLSRRPSSVDLYRDLLCESFRPFTDRFADVDPVVPQRFRSEPAPETFRAPARSSYRLFHHFFSCMGPRLSNRPLHFPQRAGSDYACVYLSRFAYRFFGEEHLSSGVFLYACEHPPHRVLYEHRRVQRDPFRTAHLRVLPPSIPVTNFPTASSPPSASMKRIAAVQCKRSSQSSSPLREVSCSGTPSIPCSRPVPAPRPAVPPKRVSSSIMLRALPAAVLPVSLSASPFPGDVLCTI